MKKIYFLSLLLLSGTCIRAQHVCNANGNVAIFSNYDGGILRINVDQNIPNLKIGIVSYEDDSVIISGTFAANVTKVVYAGYYNSTNVNCSPNIGVKSVSGVPSNIVTIVFVPPANYTNPNGYSSIICNYPCSSTTNQGGCNTPDQIVAYFNTAFSTTNANLLFHHTQYGCWQGTQNFSTSGNCCIVPVTTGLMDEAFTQSISLYPNPAKNVVYLETNVITANDMTVDLFNLLGEKVLTQHFASSGNMTRELNIAGLPKGVYGVQISSGGSVAMKKLAIE